MANSNNAVLTNNIAALPLVTLTTAYSEAATAGELVATQTLGIVAEAATAEKFSVDSAVKAIESLRSQATKNHERYDVAGRKAMLKLVAQVYCVWHDAQVGGEFTALMNNVRRLLKDLGVEVRQNSPQSSLLIRYVFSGIKAFTDKQVHVYGRSLNVAYAATPRVKPNEFEEFVSKTDGGFDGLREIGSSTGSGSTNATPKKRTPAIALDIVQKEKTCDTIDIDWPAEDTFRFYIAVRNADGTTADLKQALLSNESKEAMLLKFYDDHEKRLRPSKKAVSAADKVALAQLKIAAANQKVALLDLQLQAKEAKESGTPEQCEKLLASVKSAKVVLDSLNGSVKAFSSQIKAE